MAYSDQMNSGSRYQVMPGARRRWMVTMKFRPVAIEEKPAMKTPRNGRYDMAVRVVVDSGV